MMVEQLVSSKLVLLGEMGCGKTSIVQRFVRSIYNDHQAREPAPLEGTGSCLRLPGYPCSPVASV